MTFAPRTWVVGEVVSAAIMNQEIRDQFNSMFGAWTAYTPSWSSSGTAPNIGNGTIIGRYMKFGRTVVCHINLAMGSTTTYGTGSYNFSLPSTSANAGASLLGNAQILQGTNRWVGQSVLSPNTATTSPFFPTSSTSTLTDFMTGTQPQTLASGAQLRLTLVYESAT